MAKQWQQYCDKCFEGHNKACNHCLTFGCDGKMVSYHQMLKLKAKADMANQWTTEYPTQPGYYWIRNYVFWNKGFIGPDIVSVESDLDVCFTGDDDYYAQSKFTSAEWLGPLQPPAEQDKPQEDSGGYNTVSGLFGSWDTEENRERLAQAYQDAGKDADAWFKVEPQQPEGGGK